MWHFFYLLEIWNKCVCIVWLVRRPSVSCHSVWKLLFRRVTAQPHQWRTLCGTSTCAPVVSSIWVMTLLLVLVSKLRVWPLLLENSNLVIIWGLLRHLSVFLADVLADLKQWACISIIRKVSSLEGIRSSVNDSYCHPCNIWCGSSFYSLIW